MLERSKFLLHHHPFDRRDRSCAGSHCLNSALLPFSSRRGRVYLPQDELAHAGLSDDDVFEGRVTDKWRTFMKGQITRARMFFDEAEKGIYELNSASRWPV